MKLLNDFFHIVEDTQKEDVYVCRIRLNADHFIYKVHFQGNPVTPGICLVQIATECLERKLNRRLYLKEMQNIKFLSVLSPVEGALIDFVFPKIEETGTGCKIKAAILSGENQYAKISMIYVYEPF
ncbi:MAG: 3-hydroxyacyl-ACP dehydratase [Mediterranea sp.]|jgi:3-hydroxyacyl-[acyl-carrier-protein] dehydratase|nr:3-hydroxyacyl-ACP dehydratase [Mediterranea sp.]